MNRRAALADLVRPAALAAALGAGWLAIAPLPAPAVTPFGPAPLSAAPARPAVASHCRAGETVLYTCRFGPAARPALGSVCGGRDTVHYRYGPAAAPALDLASTAGWTNIHTGQVRGQGGGFQEHVRFTTGEMHYLVFRGADGALASQPGRTYSGIAVLAGARGERTLATLACKAGARIDADWVGRVIARAPPEAELNETPDGPFDAWF